MEIAEADFTRDDIARLITFHVRNAKANSAPGSCHALGISALQRPDITVWTARSGPNLLGCGALRELDCRHGEVKSMRVVESALRQGVGRSMLAQIVSVARVRGYQRLSFETGIEPAFIPAQTLYASFGFAECAAFGDYNADANSLFMTKAL